jgi:hypothetical protein
VNPWWAGGAEQAVEVGTLEGERWDGLASWLEFSWVCRATRRENARSWLLRGTAAADCTCKSKKFCRRRAGTLSGESSSKTAACDDETISRFDTAALKLDMRHLMVISHAMQRTGFRERKSEGCECWPAAKPV